MNGLVEENVLLPMVFARMTIALQVRNATHSISNIAENISHNTMRVREAHNRSRIGKAGTQDMQPLRAQVSTRPQPLLMSVCFHVMALVAFRG